MLLTLETRRHLTQRKTQSFYYKVIEPWVGLAHPSISTDFTLTVANAITSRYLIGGVWNIIQKFVCRLTRQGGLKQDCI